MKFQWPLTPSEVKEIFFSRLNGFFKGLKFGVFQSFFHVRMVVKTVKNGTIEAVKSKGNIPMTEHEELLKLRELVEKQQKELAKELAHE